ncbi:MAG TPA: lysophospholipid acyltransferase family protein [Magnetospirillaceae bacterium]|nr:lysophospholipid acyltransferase family protein [Magnetospirillaceae bacterium]
MIFLRSALYQILFLPWTLILCLGYLPLLVAAPRRTVQRAAAFWLEGALWMQKYVLGLSFEVLGQENLPKGGAILAAKHQSAWETMVFHRLVGDPAFVLKRELLKLPLIGWYMRGTGQIAIDRAARGAALKQMLDKGKRAVEQGRSLVIFPEGTRQPTGHAGRYHSGVYKLYEALGVPVVPIALNSGLFWGRNAFLRHPGRITLQVLPPIPPGLGREAFMSRLQTEIETATRALELQAGG